MQLQAAAARLATRPAPAVLCELWRPVLQHPRSAPRLTKAADVGLIHGHVALLRGGRRAAGGGAGQVRLQERQTTERPQPGMRRWGHLGVQKRGRPLRAGSVSMLPRASASPASPACTALKPAPLSAGPLPALYCSSPLTLDSTAAFFWLLNLLALSSTWWPCRGRATATEGAHRRPFQYTLPVRLMRLKNAPGLASMQAGRQACRFLPEKAVAAGMPARGAVPHGWLPGSPHQRRPSAPPGRGALRRPPRASGPPPCNRQQAGQSQELVEFTIWPQ